MSRTLGEWTQEDVSAFLELSLRGQHAEDIRRVSAFFAEQRVHGKTLLYMSQSEKHLNWVLKPANLPLGIELAIRNAVKALDVWVWLWIPQRVG